MNWRGISAELAQKNCGEVGACANSRQFQGIGAELPQRELAHRPHGAGNWRGISAELAQIGDVVKPILDRVLKRGPVE